jgi:hypothetical protein
MEVPVTVKLSALIRNVFTTEPQRTRRDSVLSFAGRYRQMKGVSLPAAQDFAWKEQPSIGEWDLAFTPGKVSFLCALCDSVVKTD